ncbi:hypothetical protein LTR37_015389 [Vermiconidia calcicola]|uniref:Uncharacterized protein n=1 Tax=Vermiconidia calcicola TaxID=1690605 RepID=A0ACC3MQY4_9PEZI|nr:hypothetical protein LTR37_015389 [Vermiconidia calcicola]
MGRLRAQFARTATKASEVRSTVSRCEDVEADCVTLAFPCVPGKVGGGAEEGAGMARSKNFGIVDPLPFRFLRRAATFREDSEALALQEEAKTKDAATIKAQTEEIVKLTDDNAKLTDEYTKKMVEAGKNKHALVKQISALKANKHALGVKIKAIKGYL